MLARIRGRLTYANVMAALAVFIALGGTAWALKRNSVGPRQIKPEAVRTSDLHDNAVKSAKVDDGSLLSEDFVAGELPAGPQGEQGVRGQQGAPGPPGADATKLFGYVQDDGLGTDADALLAYESGIASLTEPASTTGEYRLLFDQSLANCVVRATSGFGNPLSSGTTGVVADSVVFIPTIDPDGDNPAEVEIEVTNINDNPSDSSFFITAFC